MSIETSQQKVSPKRRLRLENRFRFEEKAMPEAPQEGLHALFIPDGNARAGKGYGSAGKKVVEVAEYLVRNREKIGNISTMTAWVFSEDNIKNRGNKPDDHFFEEVNSAFVALGIDIMSRRRLKNDRIKLQIAGDVSLLEKKDGAAAELAHTIRTVCSLTDDVTDPLLTLNIGIGNNLGNPHMVLRSGAEDENTVRNSGLIINGAIPFLDESSNTEKMGMLISAFCDFWPDVQAALIGSQVRNGVDTLLHNELQQSRGYSLEEIMALALRKNVNPLSEAITTDIDFTGDKKAVDNFKSQLESCVTELEETGKRVILQAEDGSIWECGPSDATRTYHLIPAGQKNNNQYDGFIIPISEGRDIFVTTAETFSNSRAHPKPYYSKLFLSGYPRPGDSDSFKIKDVDDSIEGAVAFFSTYKPQYGETREIEIEEMPERYDQNYFDELGGFLQNEYKGLTLEQAVEEHITKKSKDEPLRADERPVKTEEEKDDILCDFFCAKMLLWAKEFNIPFYNDGEFKAFIAYCVMSFNIHHPLPSDVNDLKILEGWEKRAFLQAIYMLPVGFMDYHIFDKNVLDADKSAFHGEATQTFTATVLDPDLDDVKSSYPDIRNLTSAFRKTSRDYREAGSDMCFSNWQKRMKELFQSHKQEWAPEVVQNPLIENLKNDDTAFKNKYLSEKTPEHYRRLIENALSRFHSGESNQIHTLRLYAYLCDIEQSIGAGLTFISASCFETKDTPDHSDNLKKLKEICYMFNIYFRIVNDMADLFKLESEKEQNLDTVQILEEGYRKVETDRTGIAPSIEGESETADQAKLRILAKIKAMSQLRNLADNLEENIFKEIAVFKEQNKKDLVWYRIAMGMERGIKVGKAFYDGTHPTKADSQKRQEIITRLRTEAMKGKT